MSSYTKKSKKNTFEWKKKQEKKRDKEYEREILKKELELYENEGCVILNGKIVKIQEKSSSVNLYLDKATQIYFLLCTFVILLVVYLKSWY